MCDFFWQRMDSGSGSAATDQPVGDLSDIVRSVNAGPSSSSSSGPNAPSDVSSWQFPVDPSTSFDDFAGGGCDGCVLRDPLLHELTGTAFFQTCPERPGSDSGGGQLRAHQELLIGDDMKRPCNLFSRVLQIPPAEPSPLSPRAIRPLPLPMAGCGDVVKIEHGVQIPSPRTPAGIKRRKSQAKKVVCIPAPAAASSRPSGEVVPSDLWAWRKYGQKPIKGSPYPRGYYRCSSSKGCPARKQVERSRTDPNMLVITYTSEHNHPWPTQRNALAGSTRSQPSKNVNAKGSPRSQRLKEEPKDTATTASSLPTGNEVAENSTLDAQMAPYDHMFDQGLFYNDGPMTGAGSNQPDDFFADLAELDPDPMSLIFSGPGLIGDKSDEDDKESCRGLDTCINMFDWGSFDHQDHSKKGV